ncbi:MAG: CHASE2 domain-containing protein [Gammaproteobacteria bacterium]
MAVSKSGFISFAISLAISVFATVLLVLDPPPVQSLRNSAFDTLHRADPRSYQNLPVRMVVIDDASLARLGQWPWPRTKLAELTRRLHDLGAGVIAFNVVFSEPDRTSPAAASTNWPLQPTLRARLLGLPDHDLAFGEALAATPSIVGVALNNDGEERVVDVRATFKAKHFSPDWLVRYPRALASLPVLDHNATSIASLNMTPDVDGTVRAIPLVQLLNTALVPSLSLETLRLASGSPEIILEFDEVDGGATALSLGDMPINIDSSARHWLHLSGPNRERVVSAWEVLEGTVDPERIRDNMVVVGATAGGLLDIHFTPVGPMSGTELHAEVLEQLLLGAGLNRPWWARTAELGAIWAAWILLALVFARLGPLTKLIITTVLLGAMAYISYDAFVSSRMLLDATLPGITLLGIFLGSTIPRFIESEVAARRIRSIFSSYVSPDLVTHLLDNESSLALGGERRECSFVMTDLANFTATMEGVNPEQAIQVLNEYLDGMISIAFQHEGMIDRIVGDAVAVIFSAPLVQTDHAARALRCAVDMDGFAQSFSERWKARGFPIHETRIGIHSGSVILGTVGGANFRDYRALGDPINTASRLEGANKYIGTRLLVSENTVGQIPDFSDHPLREVGLLLVAGKTEALRVYAYFHSDRDAPQSDYDRAYTLLNTHPETARSAFRALLKDYPNDPLLAFHLARLERGEQGTLVTLAGK